MDIQIGGWAFIRVWAFNRIFTVLLVFKPFFVLALTQVNAKFVKDEHAISEDTAYND